MEKKYTQSFLRRLSFLLLLVVLLVIAACGDGGGEAEETGTEPSEEPAEPADDGASIELKISHFTSPQHGYHTDVFEPFAEELAEISDGRITAEIYPGA